MVLVDFGGTGVSRPELDAVARALTRQATEHFSLPPPRGYGIAATIRVGLSPQDVRPDEWELGLFANPDIAGALGYHSETAFGRPLMKVFPNLNRQYGIPWSVTASHEVLETLVDPNIARCEQGPDGKFYALEVCDAVQADKYLIDGVWVSDFNTPIWFDPPSNTTGLKFDHLGLCKKALQLRPGGYLQFWNGVTWRAVFAQKTPQYSEELAHGRIALRRAKTLEKEDV